MGRYLVLTPPGTSSMDESAVFIKDGFAPLAFLFPSLWLLCRREWIFAIAAAVLQGSLWALAATLHRPEIGLFGGLALGLVVGFEGRAFVARRLESRGWTMRAAMPDVTRALAEELFFSGRRPVEKTAPASIETTKLQPPGIAKVPPRPTPGFGLFGQYGER